jgi:DNA-binding Lrp family transcriptional regulator
MRIILEDEEGVIKGPHYYLLKRQPPEKLETEILRLLREKGPLPLSALWRSLNCHLWEASAALRRLKEKGLIGESEAKTEDYINI